MLYFYYCKYRGAVIQQYITTYCVLRMYRLLIHIGSTFCLMPVHFIPNLHILVLVNIVHSVLFPADVTHEISHRKWYCYKQMEYCSEYNDGTSKMRRDWLP